MESIVLSACVTIFSLGLLVISLESYQKYKNFKLFFVSCVFFVFLVKGLLMSLGLFYEDLTTIQSSLSSGIFDLIILILLFIATLKR